MLAIRQRRTSFFENETKRNSLKLFLFEKTSYICNREPHPKPLGRTHDTDNSLLCNAEARKGWKRVAHEERLDSGDRFMD